MVTSSKQWKAWFSPWSTTIQERHHFCLCFSKIHWIRKWSSFRCICQWLRQPWGWTCYYTWLRDRKYQSDVDLNRCFILSVENSVSVRAFSWDVDINEFSLVVESALAFFKSFASSFCHLNCLFCSFKFIADYFR